MNWIRAFVLMCALSTGFVSALDAGGGIQNSQFCRIELPSVNHSLVVRTTSAITTNNLEYTVQYCDFTTTTTAVSYSTNQGKDLTNTPDRTLLAAPAASTIRVVRGFTICNTDTASAEVQIDMAVSGTNYRLYTVTLAAKATFSFPESLSGGGSTGVTSVAISGPSIISWSGTPITSTGTLTGSLASQSANVVLAGPTSGGAAAPTFRALVAADVGITTKGDLLTYSTVLTRLGVGTDGQALLADSTQATGLKWGTPSATATYNDPLALQNVGLSVTVGSSAITIALKQQDGSTDPSTGSAACNIAFASATATTGGTTMRSVTSSTTLVISNGSSLGFASTSATQRVWIGAIDNSGTVELCVWTSLSGTNVIRYRDGDIVSTTTEGAAGGADSAQTIYSTTGRTSKAMRVLGYFEIQAAGSYAWTNSPTVVRVIQPGMPQAGDIVQTVISQDGAVATGTTTTPFDDTIPQNTEGTQFQSVSITPRSSLNILRIQQQAGAQASAVVAITSALHQDSTANALKATVTFQDSVATATPSILTLFHEMLSGTTSSTTFKIRIGGSSASTITFNGSGAARSFGGVYGSYISATEIFQ